MRKIVILAGLAIFWESAVRIFGIDHLLLPPFTGVVRALWIGAQSMPLWESTWTTVELVLQSFVLSIVVAVLITGLAVTNSWGKEALNTITGIFQPLPAIALLPMAILWFGLTKESLIFVVIMSMVWPLAASLTTGFATAPTTLLRLGENYELGRIALFWKILLPLSLPSMLSGLRIAWAYGWRTVVAAELVFGTTGTSSGLGFYIDSHRQYLHTADALAGILVVIIVGLLAEALFRQVQRRTTIRWGMERA
ncbi:ABC transporter permease [Dactylosporangium fulvum]|uniref:ABC transporter permease n=1 Tax=Dactylosporangium fulvum TaxID=53359 RepID=A0ABY5VU83_9ACTN|nr:ABC transporter permease [Dactylosporangium fulvum]UWP80401.1 ABC transporter permease [Dactylosporangium fulvum]